ncbi:N-acetyltransferase [Alphaproteobacteria bacterium GH1-50]|uniref:N-acetyltransferase n=1 Tax=Kangsaoukella pontilimi TaxID=2691042 RepID=A0A7C9IHJ9_9RHOB|nr:GNAT family N-acetyltransferase [Kangsaoukella pontilimi]MXQ08749.1 N-acetyltransferase [Kangsaoukella pontilimi]
MSEFEIQTEIDGSKGRYVIRKDGEEAEMTFSIMSPGMRIVDHTGVPDAMRGEGAGRALAEHLVADARANGFKIVPLCPFVNAERRKHPDWADVFSV